MSTKDERPGLLTKVVNFVRNPSKEWADLAQPELVSDSTYDKQALKAMIERKRQNDQIRKREFDQLRKLRNRGPSVNSNLGRPSFFQTSIPSDSEGRAVTLKKIDEIEAQMSKQWWKGKQDATPATENKPSPITAPPSLQTEPSDLMPQTAVAPPIASTLVLGTTIDNTKNPSTIALSPEPEYERTSVQSETLSVSSHLPLDPGGNSAFTRERTGASELNFSTSKLFAMDVEDMTTDPELEEAAIRFANGDDLGAESGLLMALRHGQTDTEVAFNWAAALLDLYRATKNKTQFEFAKAEFSYLWSGREPVWDNAAQANMGMQTTAALPFLTDKTALQERSSLDQELMWDCPSELSPVGMESLRQVLSTKAMPWLLSWGALKSIDAQAMPLLAGLFSSLCNEAVSLRFAGADMLVRTLRNMTPSGDRSVDPVWWGVRLNALRAMQLQDEFELVALDYCVTYEVSPPSWEPAKCDYAPLSDSFTVMPSTVFDYMSTEIMGSNLGASGAQEMRGDVLGDAAAILASIDMHCHGSSTIAISCKDLVRVDFSAAGSILNWVVLRQAEGCLVHFQEVNRLVAAFFNVIGINEYARIVPKNF